MARTDIHHEERKKKLAKELWNIFIKYGYENTTLALIIRELNISKGAFYHYFPTKEACADVAVDLFASDCKHNITQNIQNNLFAVEKLKRLFIYSATLSSENAQGNENLNSPTNAVFHQKLMAALVKKMAPVYALVIEQGVKEGEFKVKYPLETAEMILTLTNFFFDSDLFNWQPEEMANKLLAFKEILTLSLQAKQNTFDFLLKMMEEES
ncbi:AcrR family transcriptional regulator [Paenibacillus marchantiophytorum]|uniref:AcrR family transcriptional regulator n=1 Tax=Paenibacillus marchantiophytorum TaxID=1619310 RepID=A0ABQ1EYS3_9BACL|nr:TetR/AcrR family transcriptional regulator [Paenibacillus marchantiophytorum]GFZ92522.1 AcrR family transcriptional regulator [Paenibacillus marchantiophytorum]